MGRRAGGQALVQLESQKYCMESRQSKTKWHGLFTSSHTEKQVGEEGVEQEGTGYLPYPWNDVGLDLSLTGA